MFEITTSSDWKLVRTFGNGFHLESEEVFSNRIGMQIFSEEIMYGSGRIDDGNIYIYEKRSQ